MRNLDAIRPLLDIYLPGIGRDRGIPLSSMQNDDVLRDAILGQEPIVLSCMAVVVLLTRNAYQCLVLDAGATGHTRARR
jgi:hypothetical protein